MPVLPPPPADAHDYQCTYVATFEIWIFQPPYLIIAVCTTLSFSLDLLHLCHLNSLHQLIAILAIASDGFTQRLWPRAPHFWVPRATIFPMTTQC